MISTVRHFAFGGTAVIASAMLAPAAQAQQRTFDIPAGEATKTIPQFGRQAGLQVSAPTKDLRGVRTRAIKRQMDVREALRQLLEGTGLEGSSNGSPVLIVRRVSSNGSILAAAPAQQSSEAPTSVGEVEAGSAAADVEGVEVEEIVIIGSRVRTGIEPGSTPVQILSGERLEDAASATADEILRSIPQNSNVNFNSEAAGINSARGDVSTVNLRGLGSGNTLILLNGRRLVNHPATQVENDVPTVIVNANTLPTLGVERLEVLRDAAGALYGTDAVAGVINTVTRSKYDGLQVGLRYGGSEGTSLDEFTGVLSGGQNFNEGRTNISVFATYFDRTSFEASERDYARSSDLSALAPPGWEGDADLVNTSQSGPFGEFNVRSPAGAGQRVRQGATSVTNATGRFHIQPSALDPGIATGYGTEIRSGSLNPALRYDTNADANMTPAAERFNGMLTLNHEFSPSVELFAEATYYAAQTIGVRSANAIEVPDPVTIPAANFYNPFGPTTSPNRLPGLDTTDVPAEGRALDWRRFRFMETGPSRIIVDSQSYRGVAGLRGEFADWDWEVGALYSEARNEDVGNRISRTALQRALSRTDATAFNPFVDDQGANSEALAREISVDFSRISETSLALADGRISSPTALNLLTRNIGLAAGVELRRETYDENRDSHVDGTIRFTDSVTGQVLDTDILGTNATPDSNGSRNVFSAYAEAVVDLVTPQDAIPLMHSLEIQTAGRFERYSDFGNVFSPKVAIAWRPVGLVVVRGSYSEGFRAPNLVQLNEGTISRTNTGRDDLFRSRVTGSVNDSNLAVTNERASNSDLDPEDSKSYALGVVVDPPFIVNLRFSVDYWEIKQVGRIGLLGDINHIRLDDVLRRGGASNPAVQREAPTAADIAAYAAYNAANGTNYQAAGEIIRVAEQYLNLDPRSSSGLDFALSYQTPTWSWGRLEFEANASRFLKIDQQPSPLAQLLIDDPLTDPEGGTVGSLIERATENPKWRGNVRLGWRHEGWRFSITGEYTGAVFDESLNQDTGETRPSLDYEIEDWFTVDTFVEHHFNSSVAGLDDLRIRIGARNLFDRDPPFADEPFGYVSSLHNNRGRFLYLDVRKEF